MKERLEYDNIQEELERVAPELARLRKKEEPVEVPADYFNGLTDTVWQQLQPSAPASSVNRWERWLQWVNRIRAAHWPPAYTYALASVAVLVIAMSLLLGKRDQPQLAAADALSQEDVEMYISAYLDEFDLHLLAEESIPESREGSITSEEDSLSGDGLDDYFDELLDEIELEELL